MTKRILTLLLALLLVLSLGACKNPNQDDPPNGDDPAVGDGTSYSDFMEVMGDIKKYGDESAELNLTAQSEYYYSFAGASVSAFRYAVEYVLWLKGEGDTLASFTADSRYTGWDTIAEINYSSPYATYFEGMLLDFQGKHDEAVTPVALASIMPMFPEEGLDFSYLRTMEINDLYTLRDSLRALEDTIYGAYTPSLTGREWDKYLFDEEYILEQTYTCVQANDYGTALYYAKQGLKANPFDAKIWRNAAMSALYAEELTLMGAYVDEGLAIFPEDESLLALKQMMIDALEDMEVSE
ncbi:MAG: hypothetical protein IJV87_10290 [Clostridia bacterium]|nr:hypothetical protein [Clostridia bacterium]